MTRARIGELTRFAVPALVSGTAYGAILGFDVFFVRLFAPEAVADYGAARSLTLPLLLVPFALSVVLLPRVAAASPERQARALARALAVSVVAAARRLAGVCGPRVRWPSSSCSRRRTSAAETPLTHAGAGRRPCWACTPC